MGFFNALGALAPLAPAQAEAADIRRQRAADIQKNQLDAEERRAQIQEAQQRIRAGNKVTIFGTPYKDKVTGKMMQPAVGPNGLTAVEAQWAQSPEDKLKQQSEEEAIAIANWKITFRQSVGRDATAEEVRDYMYSQQGMRLPSAATIKTGEGTIPDPDHPGMGFKIEFDKLTGKELSRIPVMLPSGYQDTVRTTPQLKKDANGNWVEIPVTTETHRKIPGQPNAPSVPKTVGGLPTKTPTPRGVTDTGVHANLSSQDQGLIEGVDQIRAAASRIMPLVEKAKQQNSLEDKKKALWAWAQYKAGFIPSDPLYGAIIKDVALLSGIGQSQWTRVGRGRYLFEKMAQHLPSPTDTPALLYDKVKWLNDNVASETQRAVMNPLGANQPQAAEPEVIVVNAEDMK